MSNFSWVQAILTDNIIPHNWPDILIIDKGKKLPSIKEIGFPSDDLYKVVAGKKRNYVESAEELKQLNNLNKNKF